MKRALLLLALVGCDDLEGLGGTPPPLATISLRATGDLDAVRTEDDPHLRVALVWGTQWVPEFSCLLPPDSPELAATLAVGCRDVLAFTPDRVASSVPVAVGETTELALFQLPAADVMIGDLTGRVAFGSLVVFDDRDGDDTLGLARPIQLPDGDFGDPGDGGNMGMPPDDEQRWPDVIYGASFVSMTQADRRVAFREGAFYATGFYPRAGCGDPLPGFSIVSAGGFTYDAAVAATLAGTLPAQDPATCAEDELDATTVDIALRPPPEVSEAACAQRRTNGSVRYRDPPFDVSPLDGHTYACAPIPSFGTEPDPRTAGIVQLVVASAPDDKCRGMTHYSLVGCDNGQVACDNPEWDLRANPPAWWPCPVEAP